MLSVAEVAKELRVCQRSVRRWIDVGIAEYHEAGGTVLRDLFEADDGGWLQDPALLARLFAEKLKREAEAVRRRVEVG